MSLFPESGTLGYLRVLRRRSAQYQPRTARVHRRFCLHQRMWKYIDMVTLPIDATTVNAQRNDAHRNWRMAGIALLVTRFIQGFIYWGGGSRRFIYGPSKLDTHAPHWMAYKFQSAMPGALFGLDHLIAFMLQHFYVLYAGVRRSPARPGFNGWGAACRCRRAIVRFAPSR
jgi:hypothetical protein